MMEASKFIDYYELLENQPVTPAKVAINSERAIAERLTDAWLPCQKSSALQWPAQSNYRLNPDYFVKIQNP